MDEDIPDFLMAQPDTAAAELARLRGELESAKADVQDLVTKHGALSLRLEQCRRERDLMADALNHISRVAMKGRVSTHRLEWIAERAERAAAGKEYDPRADVRPKSRDSRLEDAIKRAEEAERVLRQVRDDYESPRHDGRLRGSTCEAVHAFLAALEGK